MKILTAPLFVMSAANPCRVLCQWQSLLLLNPRRLLRLPRLPRLAV